MFDNSTFAYLTKTQLHFEVGYEDWADKQQADRALVWVVNYLENLDSNGCHEYLQHLANIADKSCGDTVEGEEVTADASSSTIIVRESAVLLFSQYCLFP